MYKQEMSQSRCTARGTERRTSQSPYIKPLLIPPPPTTHTHTHTQKKKKRTKRKCNIVQSEKVSTLNVAKCSP